MKAGSSLRLFVLVVGLILLAGRAMAGPSLVFDPATGDVLAADRAGEPWYPASLTKLMTAYVIFGKLKSGQLTLDQQIPVSELAAKQPPSKIGMKVGSTISVDLALQTMLVYSANDMAYVLAEAGGGDIRRFAQQMNLAAQRLGMTGTYYVNPNGLFDPLQVSTARDLALLVQALYKEFPEHAHYFGQPSVKLGERNLLNRNSLLRQMKNADGIKTGYVCNSGFNLIASASDNGRRLVAIIFGARNGKARADQAQKMLTDQFALPEPPNAPKIASIENSPLGTLVPADLTGTVCKGKPLEIADAEQLAGWGISFGRYETAQLANMALRGRVLAARDWVRDGAAGVVKMPGSVGYSAMVWSLDQQTSDALCAYLKQQNAYCDVMTPESFARLSAMAIAEAKSKPTITPASAQGVDVSPPRKKKKKTAAKRKN
ncbi:MAG: D-alanyl-D-alanine carboxypeptidase [Rhizobiales bacterium]|nr:D-alanyl-D-alanine carboxypeptidase [Hyphomicrobiales bacterium]